jgi:hypothetical protein
MKSKTLMFLFALALVPLLSACDPPAQSSDTVQRKQQEKILAEGTAAVGMPAIKNFRERRLLKDIIELRDQEGVTTKTYIVSELNGKLVFFCDSIGYGIPYSTQFTNPEKIALQSQAYGSLTLPQADPNGLFSPDSSDGTWVMCKDPNGPDVKPVFVEPRIVVSPFTLPTGAP